MCRPPTRHAWIEIAIVLDRSHESALAAHARTAQPSECCGVLFGQRDGERVLVTRVIRAANVTEGDRRRRYQIDWDTLLAVTRQARPGAESIVGFYHSHPDGSDRPSEHDLASAWDDMVYVIVPVVDGVPARPAAWIKPALADRFTSVSIQVVSR